MKWGAILLDALLFFLPVLLAALAAPLALALAARAMVDAAARSDRARIAPGRQAPDNVSTPEQIAARVAATARSASSGVTTAYIFRPGRVVSGVAAAAAAGFVAATFLLIPFMHLIVGLHRLHLPLATYAIMTGVWLLGPPAAAGGTALLARSHGLRLDAEGVVLLTLLRRRRLPYTSVFSLTSRTHRWWTGERRRYTLHGEGYASLLTWDWPEPPPPVAQDALFELLARLGRGAGRPLSVGGEWV